MTTADRHGIQRPGRAPGPVTIKDVAGRAGVSPGTVSNALNRPERVAPSTRERIAAAIEETNFVVNAAASRLRLLDNRAIGVLVLDVGNVFQSSLAKGAQQASEALGFTTFLCDGDASVDRFVGHIDFLEAQRVAGVLATGSYLPGVAERLERLHDRGIAVVLVDALPTSDEVCAVAVDDRHGGDLVAEHLIALGRSRITCVAPELGFSPFVERIEGVTRTAQGLSDGDVRVEISSFPMSVFRDLDHVCDQLVASGTDAVFGVNDVIAVQLLTGLIARGIRVPEDIAVIGYDDTDVASRLQVPLTSVRQPARRVGETGAKLLIEECTQSDHEHRRVLYQPELVARQSTLGQGAQRTGAVVA